MTTILLVDNDRFTRALVICAVLPYPGFQLLVTSSYLEALWALCEHDVDLVITSVELPDREGLELLTYLANYCPKLPVLTMSAPKPPPVGSEGGLGWRGHMDKPLHPHDLMCRVRDALRAVERGEHRPLAIHDMLRILSHERKTCVLRVKAGLRTGEFELSRGRIRRASCDGLEDEAAMRQMLLWESPWLRVEPTAPRAPWAAQETVLMDSMA